MNDLLNNQTLTYLMGPVVGAIIGLITNYVAIRMLFRPKRAHYIGKWQIPFTPGLIPKEKPRIAAAVGRAVGGELINAESLNKTLLSDSMLGKIEGFIDRKLEENKDNTRTLRELAGDLLSSEKSEQLITELKAGLCATLYQKLIQMNPGEKVAAAAMEEIKGHSLYSSLSFLISDKLLNNIREHIVTTVDDMAADRGDTLIKKGVDSEVDALLGLSVANLYHRFEGDIPQIRTFLIDFYKRIVTEYLEISVRSIDIPGLAEEQINALDVDQTEELIFSIMRRELNAIVYLGGLLGFLMGIVMIFF